MARNLGPTMTGRPEQRAFLQISARQGLNGPAQRPAISAPESSYSAQQQVGSWDFYRTTLDATGPVDESRTVLYRLDGAVQRAESFRNVLFSDYEFAAPSLSFSPNESFRLNASAEVRSARGPGDYGVPALVPGVSRTLWMGDRKENAWLDRDRETIDWSYELYPDWQLRNGYGHHHGRTRYDSLYAVYGSFNPSTGDVGLAPWIGTNGVEANSAFLELTGYAQTWGAAHTMLFGVDHTTSDTKLDYYTNNFGQLYTFNVFAPNNDFADFARLDALPHDFLQRWHERWEGLYAQDQIALPGGLRVLAGGRYDWTGASASGTYVAPTQPANTHRGFTPRLGLLYLLSPEASLYTSYSRSLGSLNPGVDAAGHTFKPELARQVEVGIKVASHGVDTTVAAFEIRKENVINPDPSGLVYANVADGEVRSRGLEWDLAARLFDRVQGILNYAYTDVRVTRADNVYQDKVPADVARNLANLWLKYSPSERWSTGGGITYVGHRYGDPLNTFELPGYARFDVMALYRFRRESYAVTAQLNINNLFDRSYLSSTVRQDTTPDLNILPGRPREFLSSVKIEF